MLEKNQTSSWNFQYYDLHLISKNMRFNLPLCNAGSELASGVKLCGITAS